MKPKPIPPSADAEEKPSPKARQTFFGAIGVFGRANAGKSTLVNALVGEQVSIVSPKPQTTRKRIMGILTKGARQIVFCDTPGLHPIRNDLDAFMSKEIEETRKGLCGAMYLVDVSDPRPDEDFAYLKELRADLEVPPILVFTKIDLVDLARLTEVQQAYAGLEPLSGVHVLATTKRKGLSDLLKSLFQMLPAGPHAYEGDMFTTQPEREIVGEIIRGIILERLRQEVPHSVAVLVEEFKERENGKTYISANLHLEKESHKKILIGEGGKGIKTIGTLARRQLNDILGRDIFLQLWVKVCPNWRKKPEWIRRLGYRSS